MSSVPLHYIYCLAFFVTKLNLTGKVNSLDQPGNKMETLTKQETQTRIWLCEKHNSFITRKKKMKKKIIVQLQLGQTLESPKRRNIYSLKYIILQIRKKGSENKVHLKSKLSPKLASDDDT